MALPQKVIDQLGREPVKTPGWSGGLLMFSSTLFFIGLFIYLGLIFGYKPYLNSQTKELQNKIQVFGDQISAEEQEKIASFFSQLVNLELVLENHIYTTSLFEWLEDSTQANIYYENFSAEIPRGSLGLDGVARNMEDINQQMAIFDSRPEIKRNDISSVVFSDGVWRFRVNLFFGENYFKLANNSF